MYWPHISIKNSSALLEKWLRVQLTYQVSRDKSILLITWHRNVYYQH